MIIESGNYTIYCHTNKISGKKYVGQTMMLPEQRWGCKGHRYKSCPKFHEAIKKYGWDNFYHEIIASNLTKKEADNFERLLIKEWDTIENGYNISDGGELSNRVDLGNNPRALAVKCQDKVFSCVVECAQYYGVNYHTMTGWLTGDKRMPQSFIDMGLNYVDKPINHCAQISGKRSVICDGIIYETIKACADFYGLRQNQVSRWLSGARPMPDKFKQMGLSYCSSR